MMYSASTNYFSLQSELLEQVHGFTQSTKAGIWVVEMGVEEVGIGKTHL